MIGTARLSFNVTGACGTQAGRCAGQPAAASALGLREAPPITPPRPAAARADITVSDFATYKAGAVCLVVSRLCGEPPANCDISSVVGLAGAPRWVPLAALPRRAAAQPSLRVPPEHDYEGWLSAAH